MSIGSTVIVAFDAKAVQRGLANITKSFASAGKNLVSGIISPLTNLTAMLAPTALVGGVVAFSKASSDAASNIENMRAQFELFTGSKKATEDLIKSLRKIAVDSPLELSDIGEGARSLLTYGVEAGKVSNIVSQLSEVSAGSAERFGRVSYAFGQIYSIGRLMGTELRQLTETGFNPLEFISRKTGESMMDLKKRMEDGKIGVNEVEDALKAATSEGGRFFGLNKKMSETFSGRVSMMKDAWSQLLQGFGSGLNEGLKVAANAMTNFLPTITQKFTDAGNYVGKAIGDSVAGNYDKFVAIGQLIGEALKVGMQTAWQSSGGSITKWMLDQVGKAPLAIGLAARGLSAKMGDLPSTGELLDANVTNSSLKQMADAISRGNQGFVPGSNNSFRYAKPGESSTLSDGNGNKVIEVLRSIDKNTESGAKM